MGGAFSSGKKVHQSVPILNNHGPLHLQENGHGRKYNRRDVNNTLTIDHVCEFRIRNVDLGRRNIAKDPKFGEYWCSFCSRYWNSRLSWADKYQLCKHCLTPARPYRTRELRTSDFSKPAKNPRKLDQAKNHHQIHHQQGYPYCNTETNLINRNFTPITMKRNEIKITME